MMSNFNSWKSGLRSISSIKKALTELTDTIFITVCLIRKRMSMKFFINMSVKNANMVCI